MGDQVSAIESLAKGVKGEMADQVLLDPGDPVGGSLEFLVPVRGRLPEVGFVAEGDHVGYIIENTLGTEHLLEEDGVVYSG